MILAQGGDQKLMRKVSHIKPLHNAFLTPGSDSSGKRKSYLEHESWIAIALFQATDTNRQWCGAHSIFQSF